MSELEPQRARRTAGVRLSDASSIAPPQVGRRSAAADAPGAGAAADPRRIVADAKRDLAALRDSALPAFIAAIGRASADAQADHASIEHAKQRIHFMLVAAAQRVSAAARQPGGEELGKELDAVVATATALGAFVGYESLLPHVTCSSAAAPAPAQAQPGRSPSATAAQVVRHLDGLRFEADLEAAIASLGGAAAQAERSEDDEDHQFSQRAKQSAFPVISLVVGNPNDDVEAARVRALAMCDDLTTIRTRLRAIRRDATALATQLTSAGIAGAASLAAESFEPAVVALRARFELLGGRGAARQLAGDARDQAVAADHTLAMKVLRYSPAALGIPGGAAGVDAVKLETGLAVGFVYGAGAAVRDLFVGAVDMAGLALGASKDLVFGTGVESAIEAGSHLVEVFERAPDLPALIGADLAKQWTEATTFGKGELIGKVLGYLAMTVALAAASGTESVEAELAAEGSELAAYALRLLNLADKAANPLTYLGKVSRLAKFPDAVVEWLTRGRRARKAAEEARAAEQLATELAAKAARAWTETAEGARIAAALEKGGASVELLTKLTEEQRARLPAIHDLIAKGKITYAIEEMDRVVASGVDREVAKKLENALAAAEGKTSPNIYREPYAEVPGKPDDYGNPTVERTGPIRSGRTLYHGTDVVLPEVAFRDGLAGRGPNLDLHNHALGRRDSAFRGTTDQRMFATQDGGAARWADEGGWIYEINGVPSWNVNDELRDKILQLDGHLGGNPYAAEGEQAILANVPPERIRGCYSVTRNARGNLAVGPFVPNPNYRPYVEPAVAVGGVR